MSKTKIIMAVSTVLVLCVAGLLILLLSGEESLEARIMEIFSVDGPEVNMSRYEGTIVAASAGARLHDGYGVSTGEESICHIRLDADSLVRMDALSRISVNRATATSLSILVEDGQVLVDVQNQSPEHELEVLVGNTALGVRGTLFIAGHGDTEAHVIMLEGSVFVDDELPVTAGYVVSLQDDEPLDVAPINVADLDLFAMQAILDYQERVLEAGAITEAELEWIIRMMNVPDYIWIQGVQISTDLTDIAFAPDPDVQPNGFEHIFQLDLTNYDFAQLAYMINLRRLWIHQPTERVEIYSFVTNVGSGAAGRMVQIGGQISDVSPISGLFNLTVLNLSGQQISDIRPLSSLTNLTGLRLTNNQINDISALSELTSLRTLFIDYNQISDISPVAGLTNLNQLRMCANQISDISPISGLIQLENLELNKNPINDISPIAALTNLTRIDANGLNVNDISSLASLSDLAHLSLVNNQINDVSPLARLANLEWVKLSNNQINNIGPLVELPNLSLQLYGNPITDWSPVAHIDFVGGRP